MAGDVNPEPALPPLRQAQIAHTEQRIIAAATGLLLSEGYVATTLEAVAKRAEVWSDRQIQAGWEYLLRRSARRPGGL